MSRAFYERQRLPLRICYTLAMDIRAEGVEHMPRQGGVVAISNHLCLVDPPLLGILFSRQIHFMAKEELFRFKPLGWWLLNTGTFPVRRGETDRAALKHAEDLLRAGEVVLVFPEGHRSDTAGAQAARAGAVLLAARTGSPLLPIAIAGTERMRLRPLPGHSQLERFRWPPVTVRVGEPFQLEAGGRGGARRAAAEMVMRRIVALLPPSYHGVYAGSV
jgi:1-acyl-sn-glycerol-3-phosphate acyltransferase